VHADKLGTERLLQRAAGRNWEEGAEPSEEVPQLGWERSYPPFGWLHELFVRTAVLTDGDAAAKYKVSTKSLRRMPLVGRIPLFHGHKIVARVVHLPRQDWELRAKSYRIILPCITFIHAH
jgi:hypothetical protein